MSFCVISLSLLCQCAATGSLLTSTCSGTDFFELGRQHGSQGIQETLLQQDDAIGQCIPKHKGEAQDKYLIGYQAGLADYCTEENGFNVGSSGLKYRSVCPTLSEREFLKGLQKGIQHRRKQSEVRKLDQKISILKESLQSQSLQPERKTEVTKLLSFLQKQRQQKDLELNN